MDIDLDDIFADETINNARPVGKFQPKPKFRPSKKSQPSAKTIPVPLPHPSTHKEDTIPPPEAALCNASNPENAEGKVAGSERLGDFDPLTSGDPIISVSDKCGHTDNREIVREEIDVMDSINMSDLTAKSGQRTEEFQPEPKKQLQEEIREASEPVSYSLGSQSVQPETTFTEKDSIHIQCDDILDLSDIGSSRILLTEETSELRLNEETVHHMETTQSDSGIDLEGAPEIPAKLASRRAKAGPSISHTPLDPSSHQQNASVSDHENGSRRSLRPRKGKANLCELVDEADDEVLASGDEYSVGSALDDENLNNEEFQAESESKTKKAKRKSKKPDEEKEKPTRKRKKAKEASDQPADVKPKKFSHSTRRRRVDKVLLETPEDEIDYQRVPLRDLILLAEHKERQTKKDEAAAGASTTTQSNVNRSDPYNEDENLTSEQGGEHNDEEPPIVEDSTIYFNYQTYMDKTPIARWTKQDTEVFYEGIRQFGTDLSMIQQLFPGRTRRQVKLKYKKEERQHPLRLHEALTNRTKDHSHFQTVIERLQKMAAEEKQNGDNDESIDLTGNEEVDEEGTSNADDGNLKDEAAKDEHNQEVENENENVANDDTIEDGSPLKSDDDEDDLFIWSQYKSDA